ncbi:hypothetical protein CTAYLR_001536 [Chrysophaeum taylorii]|uniref:Uncharacterized protein n=1 Tax=Chrysophaeum taylorii TaxID=2483200 RepID=A0AAD7XLM5_9STRA|nr:hypothetical protein CTAYLR_001536 [Chrysophaeum taylorii]
MESLDPGVRCHLLEFVDTKDLGGVSTTSTDWRARAEFSARLRVAEFLRCIGLEGLVPVDRARLGFDARCAWRYVLSIYARCALWLRADADVEVDRGRVVGWKDVLGSGAVARPAHVADAPRLRLDGAPSVDFSQQRGGRGLVLVEGVPEVSVGVMLAVSAVTGDSTLVDSGEAGGERFELCHGYPTDGNRDQPRICFTASNSGDPPMRALWGETRSTGDRHVYSIVFGHKSWKRASRENEQPESPPRARRLLSPLARRDDPSAEPAAGGEPPGLTIFGPRRRHYHTRQRTRDAANASTANRSAALFVDSSIEGCADVGPNGVTRGFTIGSDRNGAYRLRGDINAFALWTGAVPASCLFALERALIAKYNISPPPPRPRAAST